MVDRELRKVADAVLADLWRETALMLEGKRSLTSGQLPPRYAELYERFRAEYARRGVQLTLF